MKSCMLNIVLFFTIVFTIVGCSGAKQAPMPSPTVKTDITIGE